MVKTIKVPENIGLLSKWNGFELPNGILNKGVTACGATTLAIEDEHKTIICSPRINLVLNKNKQHNETLAVHGDVTNNVITEYLEITDKPKILVTYDSFPRLAALIEDKDDWRVVVDEYQYLLIDSSFKSDVEIRLMEMLKEFPYVTYLSATPIADKYLQEMEYFNGTPYTVLEWSNYEKVTVKRVESNRPIDNAIEIVRNYQRGIYPIYKGIESKECVIFLNSVTNIVNIIKHTGLKPDEVNIIVGSSDENDSLIKKLGRGYERGAIPLKGEPHKMVTFCTSTAFAGCDFYSTCASTFVISDNKRAHTSIDIATELTQIVGRQRLASNPFRKIVTFIYNVDIGANDETAYKSLLNKKLSESEETVDVFNGFKNQAARKNLIKSMESMRIVDKGYKENYVRYDKDKDYFEVNRMAYANECFAYDVQKQNYQDNFRVLRQLEENKFNAEEDLRLSDFQEQLNCIFTKEGFADKMERYCQYRQNKEKNPYFIVDEIMERQNEQLKVYYDALGYERIRALGYKETRLKNELKAHNLSNGIVNEFRSIFKFGVRLTIDEVKAKMNAVYKRYGIEKKGVASHLKSNFGIESRAIKIRMPNGERKNGLEFI